MKNLQNQFIKFSLNKGILKFGEFVLKSGRVSPYFFNLGVLNTGKDLAELGRFYAQILIDNEIEFDFLFGPAYKGIPIVTTTAIALSNHYNLNISYCFNRKEIKLHGEGGILVGSPIKGKVIIVDDVFTAGTTIRESINTIHNQGGVLNGILIAFDRQERGLTQKSAKEEIASKYQCNIYSIANLNHLITYIKYMPEMIAHLKILKKYYEKYGIDNY